MQGITKNFPGVQALTQVDFDLRPGEVHALLGENGAGKSTLMRILFGIHQKDSGQIRVRGQEASIRNPHHAQQLGISMVHQELNLVASMNAAQNISLGHEKRTLPGVINWPAVYSEAKEQLARLGVDINTRVPVRYLSVAQQQMVEIAKALSWKAEVLVMDEPTSALTPHEIDQLFQLLRRLTAQGVGVVFISHRMEEISALADRVTVLRDGRKVGSWPVKEVGMNQLIQAMVGRSVSQLFPKVETERREEALRVEGLARRGVLHNISFTAYRGEILGIAGLVGSGRTELARAIFGADPIDHGTIYVNGKATPIRSPKEAIRHGLAFLTEDRKTQGLVLAMPLESNLALAIYERLTQLGFVIQQTKRRQLAVEYVDRLQIRPPLPDRQARYFSGGNQQKVVLAKWLARETDILIFDEPTRGIDVGAKAEIHQLMNDLASAGKCVMMISSELPEILNMSDRILVMREGRLVTELSRQQANQELVMEYATGVRAPTGEVQG